MEETGTIFEIRRFCIHDGPGIRTTVFLKGCPLDCRWCHNPEGRSSEIETFHVRSASGDPSQSERRGESTVGTVVTAAAVLDEVLKDEPFYDESGGGVTFSGGEPMAQPEFLEALLVGARSWGLHTAVDTCGYAATEDFRRLRGLVDLFLFDLKLMDPVLHRRYTGLSNELILSNLTALARTGNKVSVRIPLVPEITDTQENLKAIASFLEPLESVRQLSLLPYNKLGEDKIERYALPRRSLKLEPQAPEELEKRASFFEALGFEVRIGG